WFGCRVAESPEILRQRRLPMGRRGGESRCILRSAKRGCQANAGGYLRTTGLSGGIGELAKLLSHWRDGTSQWRASCPIRQFAKSRYDQGNAAGNVPRLSGRSIERRPRSRQDHIVQLH